MSSQKFTSPDYILVFLVLEILSHYLIPLKKIIFSPFIYLGIPLILIGAYWNFIWVANTFRKKGTTLNPYKTPKKFVVGGPFKITRNPTYLGMALILLGVAILFGSIITFLFPIIFVILTDFFTIPIEEKNLTKKFGNKYLQYKKKVRRWI